MVNVVQGYDFLFTARPMHTWSWYNVKKDVCVESGCLFVDEGYSCLL